MNYKSRFVVKHITCTTTDLSLPHCELHRGSYMSAHVLLNLLNELRERDKMQGLPSILSLFTTRLINSIKQEHEC